MILSLLFNPKTYNRQWPDQKTRDVMIKTIAFFEKKGLNCLKEDDQAARWYDDYIHFLRENEIFTTLLTPSGYGYSDSRFDMSRICQLSEILGFYGLSYQHCYHVSILGLGPIWMGQNENVKHKAVQLLKDGAIFGFGLSEKDHGVDIYSNEMKIIPQADGTYKADGSKYYIGNANKAALVSVQGRHTGTDEYVFFVVDTQHHNYKLKKRINISGNRSGYIGEVELVDYPITREDILSSGKLAWDASFSSVNIGKFQTGFAIVGVCTHSFYEAINHASNRILYGKPVTNFPYIKKLFVDSYVRLNAMKLYALRSLDYFRSSSSEDRRYLLFNPIQKAKIALEGVRIMDMILNIVAAKGCEQDTYIEEAIRGISMLPRMGGTVHVNMGLVIKFLSNYFFNHAKCPVIPKRDDPGDDTCIFRQYIGDLAKVRFPDHRLAYEGVTLSNVHIFNSQIELFREFIANATPTPHQRESIDYMLSLSEMFTLIAYAQLIIENCKIYEIEDDLVDQIFNFLVGDFSQYALTQITSTINTNLQEKYLWEMIKKPSLDPAREMRLWKEHVAVLNGAYVMNP